MKIFPDLCQTIDQALDRELLGFDLLLEIADAPPDAHHGHPQSDRKQERNPEHEQRQQNQVVQSWMPQFSIRVGPHAHALSLRGSWASSVYRLSPDTLAPGSGSPAGGLKKR